MRPARRLEGVGESVRQLSFLLGLAISAACLVVVFWNVDTTLLWRSLTMADWRWVAAAAAASVIQLIWRSQRWRRILRPSVMVPCGAALRSYLIGQAANMVLPFRAGELLRVVVLARLAPVSRTASLASVVTERILDLFTLLALLGVTVLVFPLPAWVTASAWILALVTVGATVVLLAMKGSHRFYDRLIARLERLLPGKLSGKLSGKLAGMVNSFVSGLKGLDSPAQYLGLLLDTVAIWLLSGLSVHFLFLAFGITASHDLGWVAMLVVLLMTTLGVSVPSSPGFVGTMHLAVLVGLSLFGVPKGLALSYAVVLHFLAMAVPLAMGLLSLKGGVLSLDFLIKQTKEGTAGQS